MADPATHRPTDPPAGPDDGPWPYFGVGCITLVSGFFGGGMIAVLIAKVVGAAQGCTPDPETGAPCNWFNYMLTGAVIGCIAFPTAAVLLLRRSRRKNRNNV